MFQFNGMAQSHALIEQYSESESSLEDNPVLDPESELQDQDRIKDKVYQQGDRLSARLRGIRDGGSLFRNLNTPQPPPSNRVRNPTVTSKASKASKAGKGSETKETSEQVPTEVTPPAPQPIP